MNALTEIATETRTDILIFTEIGEQPEVVTTNNSKRAAKEAAQHILDLEIEAWEYAIRVDHCGAAKDVSDVTSDVARLVDRIADERAESDYEYARDRQIDKALYAYRH